MFGGFEACIKFSESGANGGGLAVYQELTFAPHLDRFSRDCYCRLSWLRTVASSFRAIAATTLDHVHNCTDRLLFNPLYWSAYCSVLIVHYESGTIFIGLLFRYLQLSSASLDFLYFGNLFWFHRSARE